MKIQSHLRSYDLLASPGPKKIQDLLLPDGMNFPNSVFLMKAKVRRPISRSEPLYHFYPFYKLRLDFLKIRYRNPIYQ